jgi:L-2-hydroxycarboxylate dehydrogenase (NAD+)
MAPLYPVEALRCLLESLFAASGLARNDSVLVTDAFLEANLRGVDTHGVRLAPAYLRRLEQGGINPRPNLRILSDTGACLRIDGDNGLGQVAGVFAMRKAIERAERHGLGMAVVGHTSHIGTGSYYTRLAVEAGMAGFAGSNNLPSIFVWGGRKRALSNPPFSIAFPTSRTPFVLDICLGTVAWNKIYMLGSAGKTLPPGWAWDAQGRQTTDPKAASEGGSVVPIGGHKGSSLILAVDFFTGVLSGFALAAGIGGLLTSAEAPEEVSCLMMAFNVQKILGPEVRERAEQLIAWCKDSPLAEGFQEILMPGEPEERTRAERLQDGIPIAAVDLEALREAARRRQAPFPF